MATHNVFGVPVEVDNVQFDSDGEITDWDVSIGGVEITATVSAYDFFPEQVTTELERLVKLEAEQAAKDAEADSAIDRFLDRKAA